MTLLAGAAVGGGTLINWMTCAMPPDDVRADWRRDHGVDTGDAFAAHAAAISRELTIMALARQVGRTVAAEG